MGSSASSTASHQGGRNSGRDSSSNYDSSSSHRNEGGSTIVTGTSGTTGHQSYGHRSQHQRGGHTNININASNSRRNRNRNRGVPTSIPALDMRPAATSPNNSTTSPTMMATTLNNSNNTGLPPPSLPPNAAAQHSLLNMPYPIQQRIETDRTAFLEGGAFPSADWTVTTPPNANNGLLPQPSLPPGLATNHEGPQSFGTSPMNNNNNSISTPLIMRRVHSSGGSSTSSGMVALNSGTNVGARNNDNNNNNVNVNTRMKVVNNVNSGLVPSADGKLPPAFAASTTVAPTSCLNPASDINGRLDTQVEVRVYPCNNNNNNGGNNNTGKKKYSQFTVKPEGVIIQGTNRRSDYDLGSEYARHIGRKLNRYELADTRACQLLVTSHGKSFWVVPAPEAFSRHSGTCRLLGDRKHAPTAHTLHVGDFLRVGSVGVVVIETHDGVHQRSLSEEKIQKIMRDTASGGFIDLGETDGENSDISGKDDHSKAATEDSNDEPICYMCFDESNEEDNPLITPCKCLGDTRFVHVECLRKWHTAEADNQICFLSSVDATCSVCKSTFKSDFKLKNGKLVKLFKSSLEPPYVSLLIATKHEMAQRLFNTRFQLSFNTILKPDRKNGTRPLLMGRSSGSDMVLDYRTVSARHASIRFKNGEFIFSDAGSSNGSYLYLRRPVELTTSSQSVQFRLGRSMISMKVVNKWNRRLLRAVRRSHSNSSAQTVATTDDHSIGSEEEVNITDELTGMTFRSARRTRDSIMQSLPPVGRLAQTSPQHLDLLHALAYPKRGESGICSTSAVADRKRLQLRRSTSLQQAGDNEELQHQHEQEADHLEEEKREEPGHVSSPSFVSTDSSFGKLEENATSSPIQARSPTEALVSNNNNDGAVAII